MESIFNNMVECRGCKVCGASINNRQPHAKYCKEHSAEQYRKGHLKRIKDE